MKLNGPEEQGKEGAKLLIWEEEEEPHVVRFMYDTEDQHQINFESVPPADAASVNNTPSNCPLTLEVQKQRVRFYILCVGIKSKGQTSISNQHGIKHIRGKYPVRWGIDKIM